MIKLTPFQWSSFNFFGFYCAYGVLLPFLPMWLNHHGYDTELIGTLIALGYLFRFSGAMLFSKRVSDPNRLIPLNRFLTWASVVSLLAVSWGADSVWLLLPLLGLFHLFNGGAMPIVDTIASTWQQQGDLDYGKTRLYGSVAFVIGSVSTGYLVGWLGESAIIGILTGWLVFLGVGLSFKPSVGFNLSPKEDVTIESSYWQLFKQPTTFKMILAVSLIQGSHATYYAYSTIYWSSNGISTEVSSLLWGLAVVAEIAFFFFSHRLFKAWRIGHLMMLSAFGAALRWLLLAHFSNFAALAVIQLLHAISYAMGHYAMIRYIGMQPTAHIAKLQALYFGMASCVLMALFTFIAGFAYQSSPLLGFWLMVLFALPAIWIVPKRFEVRV